MSSPRPRPSPRKAPPPVRAPDTSPAEQAPPPVADPEPVRYTPPPVTAPPPPPAPPHAIGPPVIAPPVAPPVAVHPVPADAEYAERLLVPTQLALGAVIALVAAAILLALGLWPLAIVAVLLVGAAAAYLGVQMLTVTPKRIDIGQGRGDNSPHLVQAGDVVAAEVVTLSWLQCFGLGLPDTVDTTRFTVRAGPAVSLTMRDGELLRISAQNPDAVLAVFGH